MSSPVANINHLLKQIERVLTPIFTLVLGTDNMEKRQVSNDEHKCTCLYPYQSDESMAEARAELHFLEHMPQIPFSSKLQQQVESVYKGIACRPSKKQFFLRNIQTQRKKYEESRRRKHIGSNEVFSESVEIVNEQILIENGQKRVMLSIKGQELLSLKQNMVCDGIVLNYLNFLVASDIISSKVYIFDFSFLPSLVGHHLGKPELSLQILTNIVRKNYQTMKLKLELQIDIFGFDNLIIPLKIGQHYSCYILQGANVLLQKGTQSTLIYCDNKNASIPNIPNALRIFLQLELWERKKVNPSITMNSMPYVQLLLPRQIRSSDSAFYMMLNIQILLDRDSTELTQLKMPQNRRKLYLYPRLLIFTMRQRVWNVFMGLLKQKSSDKASKIAVQLLKQRKKHFGKSHCDLDYDKIDKSQLKKYQILNNCRTDEKDEEAKFSNELKYHFDGSVNYYEDNRE